MGKAIGCNKNKDDQVVGKPVPGAHLHKKKNDKGKKGAEFPGTGATGSDENKDKETAAKQIQDAWNEDGTMWKSKSEPEATEAIKATGKNKMKGKKAKKDELAPPGAVGSSEKQDKQVVGKPVPGAHLHKKKKKGKNNAELAANQIQYAWRKRVEVNLEKREELPTTKAIGCNKIQNEQVVGKPVPGAHLHKKKNDKGKKGAEFPGTGETGSDENKDEKTAAKQIQDAWNKDGTMWKSKSEPEATEAIKATGKKKTKEKTAKKDELAPPGAVCSSEKQDKQVVGKPVLGAHQHKKKNDKGKKGAEFPGTGATGSDENKDEET